MSTSQPNTPSDASTPGAAQSQEGIVFRRRSRGINPFTTSVSQEIARQALQQEATADSDEESLKKPPPRDVPSPAAPTHAAPAPQPTSLARESTKEQHQRSSSSVPDFIGPSRSLNTSFEEYRQRGNGSPDNVVGTLAKQVRDRHGARNATGAIFKRGQKAAAGLAVVSSILGGSVLGAMVDPSQTIFDLKTYKSGYCRTFGEPVSDDLVDYTTEACLHWRTVYGIACTVSFIFNMLTLLTTISVTIGLNNWLGFSYILFVASILSLAVVLISALWIIFSKTVVIAGTVLTGIFMILSLVFMIPGMMLAWHFIRGISMELRIDPQQRGQPAIVVEGTTGVHWCAYYGRRGHRWLLSVLLAAGESADPLTENADGWSPLMMAVFNDNLRVVKQLLAAGADMDREDNRQGRSALHWAAIKGHSAVAKALLEAGADASKTDAMGFTAAELASQYKQTKTDKHAKTEEEINTWTTNLLNSALLTATQLRKHDEMQRMLDANASANSTDKRKSTALHWAANRGDIVGAKILIKAGADIHAKNEAGGTPLMEAAMMGKVDMVNLLLTTNASSSWEASGKGPSLYADAMLNACSGGHEKVVEALLGANEPASKAALEEAVKYNHVAVVKRLLDSMKTSNSCTRVLHAAVMVGSNVAVKYILDKKWEGVNDGQGTTALILAAQQGHLDIVLTLLDDRYKADVTKSDDGGRTALHWAASRGFVDVAKSLLKAGADTNAADDDGRTALHHAAYEGHTAVAELLLDHEADFRSTDSMGLTAAELAAKHRKDDVELIRLLSRGSSEVGVAAKEAESKMSPPMPCSSV